MKKKDMKRILLCMLAALMALLMLAGCGEQPPPEEEDPAPGIHDPVDEKKDPDPEETPEVTPSPSGEETPPPAEPSEKPLTLLDALYGAGEFNAPPPVSYGAMDPAATQGERITQIRAWYYDTQGNVDGYEKRVYDNSFTAYWNNGELVKLEVTEIIDPTLPDGTKYFYYYKNGNPYFIFVQDDAHQLRLYYWNAEMIRWIETDHVEHDSANPAYDQYFATSWRLYQVVTELG